MKIHSSPVKGMSFSSSLLSEKTNFGDKVKNILRETGTFLYETPMWVVAVAIVGIVLLVLHPPFAAPFLLLSSAVIFTRLAVKIIQTYDPQILSDFRERFYEFQKNHSYILYLASTAFITGTVFSPAIGAVISTALGVYKGMVVEIDVFKYKQSIDREEIKNPHFDSRVNITIF
jgi:hypothetical protein